MKTSKEYAALHGSHCPVCNSYNIRAGGAMGQDDAIVWQTAECHECGSTWVDQYRLIGYSDLEDGGRV